MGIFFAQFVDTSDIRFSAREGLEHIMTMRTIQAASLVAALTMAFSTHAAVITDGQLSVDISDGLFQVITLGGTAIDTSGFHMQQYVNGSSGGGATVSAAGSTATYSTTFGGLSVSNTSSILGGVASLPGSRILEQVWSITNTTGNAISIDTVASVDQDLDNSAGGDTVAFDAGTQAMFAIDGSFLEAVIAQGGTLGWDAGFCCSPTTLFANLTNSNGPLTGDTMMHMGLDFGTVAAGATVTGTFRYLFATNAQRVVPGDFTFGGSVPVPATFALIGLGLAGFGYQRRKQSKLA